MYFFRFLNYVDQMQISNFSFVSKKICLLFFSFLGGFAGSVQLLFCGAIHPRIWWGLLWAINPTWMTPFWGCWAGESNPGPPYISQALCPLDFAPPPSMINNNLFYFLYSSQVSSNTTNHILPFINKAASFWKNYPINNT
jgi:hypothetical protein